MEDYLHSLLEQWEDHRRDQPSTDFEAFLEIIESEVDLDTIQRLRVVATKLERIDQQLTQIGVGQRDSS
jgi:hypothetical protein